MDKYSQTGSGCWSMAYKYTEFGWKCFPLFGKIPAISRLEGGRGYLDATADVSYIGSWERRLPQANLGIATRVSDLVVLDVDPRNGGMESLSALENEYEALPITPKVKTGGEGLHLYFAAMGGMEIQRKANALGQGIDIPNYVVAPPSVHPDSGTSYIWCPERSPWQIPLATIPGWLMSLLGQRVDTWKPVSFSTSPPGWLGYVFDALVIHINSNGGRLRSNSNGGLEGRCPLHEDLNPSLSIHPEKGWKCFAGCGEGRLTTLAAKLGISVL